MQSKARTVISDEQDRREQAIAEVRAAWDSLAEAAPEHPGELIDVSHVRVLDGEGDHLDAAVAIVARGRVSRAAAQGLGETFEGACGMLAQILTLRTTLLNASNEEGTTPFGYDD
ncbi:MAG: hypothetical protein FWD57_12075 [Polyangiaceae bacterium]|nr:hypothetical protein [Polyangiaceae bacterium]